MGTDHGFRILFAQRPPDLEVWARSRTPFLACTPRTDPDEVFVIYASGF